MLRQIDFKNKSIEEELDLMLKHIGMGDSQFPFYQSGHPEYISLQAWNAHLTKLEQDGYIIKYNGFKWEITTNGKLFKGYVHQKTAIESMDIEKHRIQMYKLQEFLDFFGRLDNPFNTVSLERYESRLKDLKSKYPNESDDIIKEFEYKNFIRKSPNDNHLELTREGQDFINNGGFIKPYIIENKEKKRDDLFDIIKISAGIVAVYYLIEILKEFMVFITCHFC